MPLIMDITNTHYVLCWLYQRLNLQTKMRMRFRSSIKKHRWKTSNWRTYLYKVAERKFGAQ
jgi:hypothetical protein